MDDTNPVPPERPDVRIPAESLRALSRAARGADEATGRALREAGRRAGAAICAQVAREADPGTEPMAAFWGAVREALAERGLGGASYGLLAPGVAEVLLTGGPEVGTTEGNGAGPPGCPFATGLVAGLLSEAAGSPVAVLEVECGSRGSEACRFLVGDETRLRSVRGRVLTGSSVEEAVGAG